jgi:hypothetical protein
VGEVIKAELIEEPSDGCPAVADEPDGGDRSDFFKER